MSAMPWGLLLGRAGRLETGVAALCVAVLVGLVCGEELDLDWESVPGGMPRGYVDQRTAGLEESLVQLRAREREEADPYRALALAASCKARQVALHLLLTARERPDANVMVLYGLTVDNAVKHLDSLFSFLPTLAHDLAKQAAPSKEAVEDLARVVQAMQDFSQTHQPPPSGTSAAGAAAVEAYVYRVFAPLAAMLEPAGLPPPVSTWSAPRGVVGSSAGAGALPMDLLVAAAGSLGRWTQSKGLLLEILERVRSADRFADLRPRAAPCVRLMSRLVHWCQVVEGTEWLTQDDRDRLDVVLAKELAGFKDPAGRPGAVVRLERLLEIEPVLRGLQDFHGDAGNRASLEALFSTAVASCMEARSLEVGLAALRWLGGVVEGINGVRGVRDDGLGPDARRAMVRLRADYEKFEYQLLEQARALAGDLNRVYHPSASAMLGALGRWRQDMDNVVALSQGLEAVAGVSSRSTLGVNQRMNKNVDAFGQDDSQARRRAADEVAQWGRQARRFVELPGEALLREQAKRPIGALDWLGPDAARSLLEAIERQRAAWVWAWATGEPPSAAERSLEATARLMTWIDRASNLANVEHATALLNRWAGWEVQPEAMARWVSDLRGRLAELALLPGQEKVDELEGALDQLEGDESDGRERAGLLLVALYTRLGPQLAVVPRGASGVLSQLLYPPEPTSFLAPQWEEFAMVSRYFNEMADVPSGESRWTPEISRRCGRLTRLLLGSSGRDGAVWSPVGSR